MSLLPSIVTDNDIDADTNTTFSGVHFKDIAQHDTTAPSTFYRAVFLEGRLNSTNAYMMHTFTSLEIRPAMNRAAFNIVGLRIKPAQVTGAVPGFQMGLWIDNIDKGDSGKYSIYTGTGGIRLGGLAGSGNRTVMVNSAGDLYT